MKEFILEHHWTCSWDSLYIYDGNNTADPLLDYLCGEISNNVYISSGLDMLLEFTSDVIVPHKGFHLQVFAIDGNVLFIVDLFALHNCLYQLTKRLPMVECIFY